MADALQAILPMKTEVKLMGLFQDSEDMTIDKQVVTIKTEVYREGETWRVSSSMLDEPWWPKDLLSITSRCANKTWYYKAERVAFKDPELALVVRKGFRCETSDEAYHVTLLELAPL